MEKQESENIWLYLEIMDGSGMRTFRGLAKRADYEAVLEGSYNRPFFTLEKTFWGKDDGFIIAGRGENRKSRFLGTFHLPARWIVVIAPITDCTDLFVDFATQDDVASNWERQEKATAESGTKPETPNEEATPERKPRRRKSI